MLAYIIRRLLYVVPTLLGVNILVFVLFFMVNTPDDMARQALGEKNMDPLQVERWKEAHGYEVPLFWNGEAKGAQCLTKTIFFRKSLAMLWGNFGHSDMTQESIGGEIRRRALPSLCVSTPIFLATLLINIILAMIVATKRGSVSDMVTQFLCVALMSISGLIYIIAGQYFFAKLLRWTPVSGFLQGMDMWKFLVLPILVGTVSGIGGGVRLYRTLFLEEINLQNAVFGGNQPRLCADGAGQRPARIADSFSACFEKRDDSDSDERAIATADADDGQHVAGELLQHSGTWRLHNHGVGGAGFRHRTRDGVSRLRALHHRSAAGGHLLLNRRSADTAWMNRKEPRMDTTEH